MTRSTVFIVVILVQAIAFSPAAMALNHYIEITAGHSEGDFDTDVTTRLTRLGLSAGTLVDRHQFDVSLSYLHAEDSTGAQDEGLGDVVLHYGYTTAKFANDLSLYTSLAMKVPTADETKNLGSGETDYGVFFSLNKHWPKTIASIGAGYIVFGEPAGADYDNSQQLSLSIHQQIQRLNLGLYLNYQSAYSADNSDAMETGTNMYYLVSGDSGVTLNAFKGLKSGSPDFGLQIGWLRWF